MQNPYAPPPPVLDDDVREDPDFFLEGRTAYSPTPARFPPICVKCGHIHDEQDDQSGAYLHRKARQAESWILVTILLSPILMVILYALLSRRVQVSYYVCRPCNQTWQVKRQVNWVVWGITLLLWVAFFVFQSVPAILLAVLGTFLGLATLVIAQPLIRPHGYRPPDFIFRSLSKRFVDAYHRMESSSPAPGMNEAPIARNSRFGGR